jgi:hypothetical protein
MLFTAKATKRNDITSKIGVIIFFNLSSAIFIKKKKIIFCYLR